MSEIKNVITEDWGGHSHGEVEDALKGKLAEMEQSIEGAADGYKKPATGIPKSDLASDVQTSLGNADTAVQDANYVHTDNNYTSDDKSKLSGLHNYDDAALAQRVSQLENAGFITEDDLPDGVTFDAELNDSSENGVQNKVVKVAIDRIQAAIDALTGTDDTTAAINTMNEVVDFLAGVTNSETLAGKLNELRTLINGKVDAVSGKGLSTEDYTTVEKTKLGALPTKAELDASLAEAGKVKTVSINGQTKTPDASGDVDLGTIVGEKGEKGDTGNVTVSDGVAQITIVNDLKHSTNDSESVLSAYQGYLLGQRTTGVLKSSEETIVDVVRTPIPLGIEIGARTIGKGWIKTQVTNNIRAYSQLFEIDGNGLKYYQEENSANVVNATFENVINNGKITIHCIPGYELWLMVGRTMTASTSESDYYNINLESVSEASDIEIDLTVAGTKDISVFKYFTIGLRNSTDTTLTNADIGILNGTGGLYIVKEEAVTVTPDGEAAIEIIGINGVVEKTIVSESGEASVRIYTKDAVDALADGASSAADLSEVYRKPKSGESVTEEHKKFVSSDFAAASQRQPGLGVGKKSGQPIRMCIDKAFDLQSEDDSINLNGIVSIHIPDGYSGGATQCKVLEATSDANNYLISNFNTGDVSLDLNPDYRYVTFNFKRDDNGQTTDTDVAAFVAGFYMVKETQPTVTNTTAFNIIGLDGSVVKKICCDTDNSGVNLASKEYVDAKIPSNDIPKSIRVLSWNIGHFCIGSNMSSSITDTNYNDKLKQWKQKLNASCANVLLFSEFDPIFGSHTVDGTSVNENSVEALFNPLFAYSYVGTKYGYPCNAILAKQQISNGASVNYTQRGTPMYYSVATINIGEHSVKLVATHLDWSQNETYAAYRAAQIQQLITAFKDEPYVIIGGDFNIDATSEWDTFVENGFSIVNHGDLGDIFTYPASGANEFNTAIASRAFPDKAIDNIVFKGFRASNIQLIDEGSLSDHCGLMCDLTLI